MFHVTGDINGLVIVLLLAAIAAFAVHAIWTTIDLIEELKFRKYVQQNVEKYVREHRDEMIKVSDGKWKVYISKMKEESK